MTQSPYSPTDEKHPVEANSLSPHRASTVAAVFVDQLTDGEHDTVIEVSSTTVVYSKLFYKTYPLLARFIIGGVPSHLQDHRPTPVATAERDGDLVTIYADRLLEPSIKAELSDLFKSSTGTQYDSEETLPRAKMVDAAKTVPPVSPEKILGPPAEAF